MISKSSIHTKGHDIKPVTSCFGLLHILETLRLKHDANIDNIVRALSFKSFLVMVATHLKKIKNHCLSS